MPRKITHIGRIVERTFFTVSLLLNRNYLTVQNPRES